MNPRLTSRTIAGAATVLALAGGGVAYAASGDTTTTQSRTTTRDGTGRAGPGRDGFGPGGPGGPRFGFHHGGPGGGPGIAGFGLGFGPGGGEVGRAVADYLGLTERALRDQLADGRSLADVARAQGKTVDGLEDAIVAATKTQLDRAVDDGWLGARARDEILTRLREHVADLVARTPPPPPAAGRAGRFERRSFGPGGPRGGDCRPPAPGDRTGRAAAPDRAAPARPAPAPDRDGGDGEQGSSTQPGSWDGATVGSTWS
ncbi:hypothetical protein [Conexibacter sp. CPCC 206217]|uniref:hypothetical protein n=1 Tax=Conexibacter sp. CPCC 206217 TaxID=3064574 RepID=UPI002717108E|nr:hypothetical protein [Conexibacter sp. CPCC 206217]MDO8210877.1 hypothetical protein [Conexibacter sp. CPCC 206217]